MEIHSSGRGFALGESVNLEREKSLRIIQMARKPLIWKLAAFGMENQASWKMLISSAFAGAAGARGEGLLEGSNTQLEGTEGKQAE